MEKIKYLIIGGGISGLSLARELGSDYIIVDKESSLGGLCRTHYVKDFVWDYAGHFFHFTNDKLKKLFEDSYNKSDIVLCKKNTKIYFDGYYIDYPFQKNIHQLKKDDFIQCLYYLYFRENKTSYANFLEMLYGKFGKGITDKFLKPYNEKLYACHLNDLDVDSMGRFFPYADIDGIIKNMMFPDNESYNENFRYPKMGAQSFIDILQSKINDENVRLKTTVESIDIKNKVAFLNNQEIKFDYLINTAPFDEFVKLYNPKLDRKVLSANKVLVFNIGFNDKTNIGDVHWIYFPSKEYVFYRVGFYDNILASARGSIYVEIGFDREETLSNEEIEKLFARVLKDLKNTGVISNQKVDAYEALVINPGYVHITKESNSFVARELMTLKLSNIYSIGRYGRWTYCSMEDCILDAIRLSEILKSD